MSNKTPYAPSEDNEKMVLGCMLGNEKNKKMGCETLDASHFVSREHQEVFKSLKVLHKDNKPGEVHLVSEELKKKEQKEYSEKRRMSGIRR